MNVFKRGNGEAGRSTSSDSALQGATVVEECLIDTRHLNADEFLALQRNLRLVAVGTGSSDGSVPVDCRLAPAAGPQRRELSQDDEVILGEPVADGDDAAEDGYEIVGHPESFPS